MRISLKNISKSFKIDFKRTNSFLVRFLHVFGHEQKKKIEVLKNVSLEVKAGEILGVVGRNGSGKSTLIEIIAGILKPDQGEIETKGKIISLNNLSVGLKEKLTTTENIFLIGAFFGLGRKEIKKKLAQIIEFSGLKEFSDTKIYQLSSGMLQRLVFSIAFYSNPGIFLLDEIFEIADENFKKKSVQKIKELAKNGVAVVLVSHNPETIKTNCSRVISLEKGEIFEK